MSPLPSPDSPLSELPPSLPASNRKISLLLADYHPVVRRGIKSCLTPCPRIEVLGEAADGQEALSKTRELMPDVLLTDLEMPNLSGLAVAEALRKEHSKTRVLILSAHANPTYVLRSARAGASGYVLKQAPPDELVRAIETVNAGQPFFSPEALHATLNQYVRGSGQEFHPAGLTTREREVLVYIAEGLSNKEMAERLHISPRTVETYRERLMRKLDIHTIAGLTRFAVAQGLTTIPELAVV